jgi:hypothetical protein
MSMAEERRAPRVAVVRPVVEGIDALPADQRDAVRAAIRTIGIERGEPIDLPTAPAGFPYRAQRPHLTTAPLVIYRESQRGEQGDYLVVSLMTPEAFQQQKQDELSTALRNPDVRDEIASIAGTAATTVSAEPGTVRIAPSAGAAATTSGPRGPASTD